MSIEKPFQDIEGLKIKTNAEITCLYGAESPEIVEGRQRNRGRVD
jgi:hypothetical protein